MKKQVSIAVLALISTAQAEKWDYARYNTWNTEIQPPELHYNEDPHSVPTPLAGKNYMTSTMAHLVKTEQSQLSTEVPNIDPLWHRPYNARAPEPPTPHWPPGWANVQLDEQEGELEENEDSDDSQSDDEDVQVFSDDDSDDDSDSDSDDEENLQVDQKWRVIPDVAELDDHVVTREKDIVEAGGGVNEKFSGWHNPLADTDNGNDDDTVVVQINSEGIKETRIRDSDLLQLQYEESEGPTKVDYGENDPYVVYREFDIVEPGAGVNKKFSGWHNPLSDTDSGDNDESVL